MSEARIEFADDLGGRWSPAVGDELDRMMARSDLPEAARDEVTDRALQILSKCVPPGQAGADADAGLVVGNVQSGKTASFTAVTALARDNGYALVILLLGTTTNLLSQGTDRIVGDLGIGESAARREVWAHLRSPSGASDATRIDQRLRAWVDEETVGGRPTVVLTVMKEHTHLANCIDVLGRLTTDLSRVTALVIDDEADQASMDASRPGQPATTTYRMISELRSRLPRHTLLQYTATPQANLLAELADEISPNFVRVLNAGEGYVGGEDFFADNSALVETIPADEVEAVEDHSRSEPPTSLQRAMAQFLLGVAKGQMDREAGLPTPGNRSMLIHPARQTVHQGRVTTWVRLIRADWQSLAYTPEEFTEIEDFVWAHEDLSQTVDLPPLEEMFRYVAWALNTVQVRELNTAADDERPDWVSEYAWILVGGQMLDRGYTVEGLTVTYMPRGSGVGNADTIQQRARFYGYKRHYLEYCRLWLAQDVREALAAYVDHERVLRTQLQRVQDEGLSLNEWRRQFVLDPALRPTRASVVRHELRRISPGRWYKQQQLNSVVPTDTALQANRSIHRALLDQAAPIDVDLGFPHEHSLYAIGLDTFRTLTVDYHPDGSDREWWLALIVQLSEASAIEVTLVSMNGGARRRRRLATVDRLQNLHQGRNPAYVGDASIRVDGTLTIQLHNVDVLDVGGGPTVREAVPAMAVYAPDELAHVVLAR